VAGAIMAMAFIPEVVDHKITVTDHVIMATAAGGAYGIGGDTITTNGTKRVHTFTTISTTTFEIAGGTVTGIEVLVVAGGGSGGSSWGGGGGGGGVTNLIGLSLGVDSYEVIVGMGAPQANNATVGKDGNPSTFNTNTMTGGGGGGSDSIAGRNGGCGGGEGAGDTLGAGTGTAGMGYDGGLTARDAGGWGCGGGGGSSELGHDGAINDQVAGQGGEGFTSSISGSSHIYGSGGGATGYDDGSGGNPTGGLGGTGGGRGTLYKGSVLTAYSDATYYGCGGGASAHYTVDGNGGVGYQGIVIVSYEITQE